MQAGRRRSPSEAPPGPSACLHFLYKEHRLYQDTSFPQIAPFQQPQKELQKLYFDPQIR